MIPPDPTPPLEDALRRRLDALAREIEPPADVWNAIAARLGTTPPSAAAPLAAASPAWGLVPLRLRFFSPPASPWRIRPAIAAALVLCASGVGLLRLAGLQGWRVAQASGPYALAAGRLETAAAARVRLAVGTIGEVDVAPLTRVRLLSTRPDHRLALDGGTITARITAPPRLFYVETPSATAVDLGCSYTLTVEPGGGSLIHVTVGWVELRRAGRTSVVPFDMSAYTRPGFAPGTPFGDHAPDSLKAALYRFDFEHGGDAAAAGVVRAATPNDAVTLWHLLSRTSGPTRRAVYARLATIAPPPAGVTEAAVLALERRALRAWWDSLPGSPGTLPWWQRAAVRVAAWLGVL